MGDLEYVIALCDCCSTLTTDEVLAEAGLLTAAGPRELFSDDEGLDDHWSGRLNVA